MAPIARHSSMCLERTRADGTGVQWSCGGRRILAGGGPRQGEHGPTGRGIPSLSAFTARSAGVGEATTGVIQ
ncbi:hypothetical protein AB0N14_29240 [Streptomyces sp. NPDC051104]|uniref:hypothetical protein n=1 Tax=Streptomyces sp. NPDC051104 TaxID=3155044 RepID=UPI003447ABAF